MSESQQWSLTLEPDATHVGVARSFAAAVATEVGCQPELVSDLRLALSEACTNAVKSHMAQGRRDAIHVIAAIAAGQLRFEVVDRGSDAEVEIPDSLDDRYAVPEEELPESGIGLAVIRALFPDVEIAPNENGGMTLRFSVAV